MGYGVKSSIGLQFQADRATPAAGTTTWFEYLDESVTVKIPQLVAGGMRGIFDAGDSHVGPKMVDGDINIETRVDDLGVMLNAMFGATSVNSTVEANSAYNHIWEPAQADLSALDAKKVFTLHKRIDQEADATGELLTALNLGAMEFNFANGDFLKTKISVMGGEEGTGSVGTAPVPAFSTGRRMTWGKTSVEFVGVAECDFRELTVNIDDALEAQHTLCGTEWPTRIKRTDFRGISVSGTIVFSRRTHLAAFLAQTENALTITTTGAALGGGNFETLILRLPAMRYSEFDYGVGGPGSLELSVTASAKYLVSSGTALQVELQNSVNSYS